VIRAQFWIVRALEGIFILPLQALLMLLTEHLQWLIELLIPTPIKLVSSQQVVPQDRSQAIACRREASPLFLLIFPAT